MERNTYQSPLGDKEEAQAHTFWAVMSTTPATSEPPSNESTEKRVALGVPDIIVVVIYFVFVLAVGIWVSPGYAPFPSILRIFFFKKAIYFLKSHKEPVSWHCCFDF